MVVLHASQEGACLVKSGSGKADPTGAQAQERLGMKMSELVENVSKKPVPPHARNILVEVMCNDAEGEDVEVGVYDRIKGCAMLIVVPTGSLLSDSHLRKQEEGHWN